MVVCVCVFERRVELLLLHLGDSGTSSSISFHWFFSGWILGNVRVVGLAGIEGGVRIVGTETEMCFSLHCSDYFQILLVRSFIGSDWIW